jgi:hypothetical protein
MPPLARPARNVAESSGGSREYKDTGAATRPGAFMISAALCAVALAAPLQFESPGARLDQLLPELSKLSGVSLRADARTAEDVLAVRMDGQSLDWFMERAAWVSGAQWRQTPEGWLLERTAAQETALIREAANDQADLTLANMKKASALMPKVFELFMQEKEEEAMMMMFTAFSDPEMVNDVFEQAIMSDVVETLGLRSLFTMPVGQTIQFSTRPNRLEQPLTPAMRDAMMKVLQRMNSLMRMSLMMDESMRQPEILAVLNRTPNLDAASISVSRSGNEVAVIAQTGERAEGGMMDMGLSGPMAVVFSLEPRRSAQPVGHPFGEEKAQPVPFEVSGMKPEQVIAQLAESEPLAKAAGEPMLKAAQKAGASFVAMLPDSLLESQAVFTMNAATAAAALERTEEGMGIAVPQMPADPGLAAHFEWQDGAGRPWALGRAIESRFSRKAMVEMLKRHLNQREGIVTAAMAVSRQVRPAAWGGPYTRLIDSAIPWLSQSAGIDQVKENYSVFQFLSSLPRGVLSSITKEPMTRFDPGMMVRAEQALCGSANAEVGPVSDSPIDSEHDFDYFGYGGNTEPARAELGRVPPGTAQFKLSGSGTGQVLAYNARTGLLEVLNPEELGNSLGSAENPEQADMRIHMPDYRSFAMLDQAIWSLSARIPSRDGQASEVSVTLMDTRPPSGAMAGMNRLPKSIQDRIESSRKDARGGGGQR